MCSADGSDSMLLIRYLSEWKTLLLLLIAIYGVLYHFAYKNWWKNVRISAYSGAGGLLTSSWNDSQWFSRSGGVLVSGPIKEPATGVEETTIAIGCAITSRKLLDVSESNVGAKFQYFHTFLPSFCHTASQRFVYAFYLAYDRSDRVFADRRLRDAFRRQFHEATASGSCADRGITAKNLSLVECDYTGKPAWAQNDAMMEAYLDHVHYFYRINDDTKMLTAGWTEKFISTLEGYHPPRVGVVGPKHRGGNVGILTYDFVHRTHVDIFGFYYPHLFTDWFGDTWITRVYKPNRSTKISEVHLAHTLGLGQRYRVHYQVQNHLGDQLARDIAVVKR